VFVAQRRDVEITPEIRRKHPRRTVAIGTVDVAVTHKGTSAVWPGKLLNLSPAGVLIKQRRRIDCGIPVLVRLMLADEEAILPGSVVHCTETVGGYKVGIRLLFDNEAE
jgi:hypothetical protein